MDDNDVSLPKATLQKMIKELVPNLRCNPDTVDLLIECCTEFVHLLSSESNDISNRERKNTIHPEHVLQALADLGFGEFVPEVKESWENWKADHKTTASLRKQQKEQGRTEGELIALQRKLLDEARARSNSFQTVSELGDRTVSDDPAQTDSAAVLSMPLSTFESMMPPCSTKLVELQSPFSQTTQTVKSRHLSGSMSGLLSSPSRSTMSVDISQSIAVESGIQSETNEDRLPHPLENPISIETDKTNGKEDDREQAFDVDPVRSDTAMSIDTTSDRIPDGTARVKESRNGHT